MKELFSKSIPFISIIIMVIVFGINSPDNFFTKSNFLTILQNSAVLITVAIGASLIIMSGSIDLSVGSVMALSGVITATFIPELGIYALLIAPIIGALLGLINGCLFVFGKISSFIVTIGTLYIFRGLTILYTNGQPISIPFDSNFMQIGNPPIPIIIAFTLAIVIFLILHFTPFGKYIYAIGGDEEKTKTLGVPVNKIKIILFTLAGICSGIGGAVVTSQIGTGSPTTGTNFELIVITSVVIGGIPLTGGSGSLINAVLGAITLILLENGLVILGVQPIIQTILIGVILIVSVLISLKRDNLKIIK